ncbi:TIGR04076 family protein [Kineococcus sp. SYSU DK018]|uniref:TIGR04076 family protein n=1 Tax=Kineococcus sp. SYSU DK018 TaxID=3383139 RepID=UPI003D7E3354
MSEHPLRQHPVGHQPTSERLPACSRVRVVVERADAPRCAIAVGDSFDVDGSGLSTGGRAFCPFALAAVVPVLGMMQGELPADDWLVRKPLICCPDATENVVMRLERIGGAE